MSFEIYTTSVAFNALKGVELYSKEKQVFQWLCEKLVSGEYRIED